MYICILNWVKKGWRQAKLFYQDKGAVSMFYRGFKLLTAWIHVYYGGVATLFKKKRAQCFSLHTVG